MITYYNEYACVGKSVPSGQVIYRIRVVAANLTEANATANEWARVNKLVGPEFMVSWDCRKVNRKHTPLVVQLSRRGSSNEICTRPTT